MTEEYAPPPPLTDGYTPTLLTEEYMPSSPQLQQYLQSNEEEPYYILKTNNPVFLRGFQMDTIPISKLSRFGKPC
jgi:hypothetical protein